MPAKPTRRRAEPNAGPVIVDERLTAVPAQQAAAPAKPVKTTRQTLDLPTDDYQRLHDQVRDYGRQHGLTSRDFNAQRVLRALVARMLADDELAADVFRTSAGT